MGIRSLDPLLVLAPLRLLLRAGLLLRLVQESSYVRRRDCSREFHPTMDGMSYWLRGHRDGWRGHRAGHDPFAVVARPQGDEHDHSYLRREPRGACERFNPSPTIALRRGGGEPLELPGESGYRREGSRRSSHGLR